MLCDEDDWQHLRLSHAKLLSSLFYGTLFAYYLCFINDISIRINCNYNKRYYLECQYHINLTFLKTFVKCMKNDIIYIIFYNNSYIWYYIIFSKCYWVS